MLVIKSFKGRLKKVTQEITLESGTSVPIS